MFNIYFKEMKKFISLFALVGVFAACEPENLQTAFNVPNATAKVNVTVLSAAPGFAQKDATITYAWSTGETTESITGTPSIPEGSVTVTATWHGSTASTIVKFPQIYAGMNFELAATVFLPYNVGGYELSVKEGTPVTKTEVYGLQVAAEHHGYATPQTVEYDGKTYDVYMAENASEYILEDTYGWISFDGYEIAAPLSDVNTEFEDAIAVIYAAYVAGAGYEETPQTHHFTVGAWSLYNVINPVITVTTPCTIEATPLLGSQNPTVGTVAKFSLETKSAGAGHVEMAHPDHASHYVYHSGHLTPDGHYLHGDNNNAGGGIISAE